MQKFYSPSVQGFYTEEFTYPAGMPGDVVKVSDEKWREVQDALATGKVLRTSEDGQPYAADPVPHVPPIPRVVPMLEGQLALSRKGKLDAVEAIIGGMAGQEGVEARLIWSRAQNIDRDTPLVQNLIAALELTEEETDELFALADSLK
jgi:hypothetical protein